MAYRVWIGSVPIDCDEPEEAVELARRAEGESSATPKRSRMAHFVGEMSGEAASRWTEKRAGDFFRIIEGKQKKLIETLLEHPDGRTDEQLLQVLSLNDGRALAGVIAGLWKNAKKIGADPEDLYEKKRANIGGKRVHEYFLSESFRRVAQQVAATLS